MWLLTVRKEFLLAGRLTVFHALRCLIERLFCALALLTLDRKARGSQLGRTVANVLVRALSAGTHLDTTVIGCLVCANSIFNLLTSFKDRGQVEVDLGIVGALLSGSACQRQRTGGETPRGRGGSAWS